MGDEKSNGFGFIFCPLLFGSNFGVQISSATTPTLPFPAQPRINSGIGCPFGTIGVGRPLKSLIASLAESMPRW